MALKFGVIVFPGSNCDDDMVHVLSHVMGQDAVKVWHKDPVLPALDCVILPGGFSYGDYVRSGAIARFSPVMQAVQQFARDGGYVLGICNGFQILCEAGLLPGALLRNANQQFICDNVWISAQTRQSAVTAELEPGKALKIPIAHAEGRYYAPPAVLDAMEANDQILFRYCDAEGRMSDAANPNGSERHIAGICNAGRNVFGMMPHPERAAEEVLGNTDGKGVFLSLQTALAAALN